LWSQVSCAFFSHEEKNASWEAVTNLPDKIETDQKIFKIKKLKVEVKYDDVDAKVEEIWSMNPHLVVHVGVHGQSTKIKIEKCAENGKFMACDYASKTLCEPIVCLKNNKKCVEPLHTKINVDKIVKSLNENYRAMFETSVNVGNFLCGYIYLKSLDMDPSRCLFVHVPCIDKPFSTKETSAAILKIIEQCLVTPLN
jgi:pyroglutamyl-peptidase